MHIELEKYAHLNSIIHRWNPRFKIFSLFLVIIGFSFIKELSLLPFVLILSFSILLISHIPFIYIFNRIKYIILFLIPMLILLILSSGGKISYTFLIFTIYEDGLIISLIIFIRTISILIVFFVMLETATFNSTITALYLLKVPEKLINILFFTYRYIHVYLEELRKMRTALIVRGYKNSININSFKIQAGIIGSIIVRSFEQAERICAAMVLRGYSGKIMVNGCWEEKWHDYLKSILLILIILILLGVQYL